MPKFLIIITSILLLGCTTKRAIPKIENTYFSKVMSAVKKADCSEIKKGEADNYFYLSQYKTDTTGLFLLLSEYNKSFTSATGRRTIGTCHGNEICEHCKDLVYSIMMITKSLEYKDLSTEEKIEKWYNDAMTFTDRSEVAYAFRKHFIRSKTIRELVELYDSLRSGHRSFLFGRVESKDDLEQRILEIKEELMASSRFYQ